MFGVFFLRLFWHKLSEMFPACVCRLAASLGLLLLCVCMCLSGVRQTVASCRKNWWNWRDCWCGWRPPAENKHNCVAGSRAVKECSRWGFLVRRLEGRRLVSLNKALCLLAYLIFKNLLPLCMCPSLCVGTQCVCVCVCLCRPSAVVREHLLRFQPSSSYLSPSEKSWASTCRLVGGFVIVSLML